MHSEYADNALRMLITTQVCREGARAGCQGIACPLTGELQVRPPRAGRPSAWAGSRMGLLGAAQGPRHLAAGWDPLAAPLGRHLSSAADLQGWGLSGAGLYVVLARQHQLQSLSCACSALLSGTLHMVDSTDASKETHICTHKARGVCTGGCVQLLHLRPGHGRLLRRLGRLARWGVPGAAAGLHAQDCWNSR